MGQPVHSQNLSRSIYIRVIYPRSQSFTSAETTNFLQKYLPYCKKVRCVKKRGLGNDVDPSQCVSVAQYNHRLYVRT